MASKLTPDVVITILTAAIYRNGGASLTDIMGGFITPPERRTVHNWVGQLHTMQLLDVDASQKEHRYFTTDKGRAYLEEQKARQILRGEAGSVPAEERPASPVPPPVPTGDSPPKASPPPAPARAEVPDSGSAAAGAPSAQPSTNEPGHAGSAGLTSETAPSGMVPSTGAPQTRAEQFEVLFQDQIFPIVIGVLPRPSALIAFQNQSRSAFARPADRNAYVEFALDRLSRLTMGECARQEVRPEQYELWRRTYFRVRPTGHVESHRESGQPLSTSLSRSLSPSPSNDSPTASGNCPPAASNESPKVLANPSDEGAGEPKMGTPDLTADTPPNGLPTDPDEAEIALSTSLSRWVGRHIERFIGNGSGNASGKSSGKSAQRYLADAIVRQVRALIPTAIGFLTLAGTQLFFSSWWVTFSLGLAGAGVLVLVHPISTAQSPRTGTADSTADLSAEPAPGTLLSLKTRRLGGWTCIAAGVLLPIFMLVQRARQHPSTAELSTYLVHQFASVPVRIASLRIASQAGDASGCDITYRAVLETTEPLYKRLNAESWLATQAASGNAAFGDPGSTKDADKGVPAVFPDAGKIILITTQTAAGTGAVVNGSVFAQRRDGQWVFTTVSGYLDRSRLAGEVRPAGNNVYAVDLPADLARLAALLSAKDASTPIPSGVANGTPSAGQKPEPTPAKSAEPIAAADQPTIGSATSPVPLTPSDSGVVASTPTAQSGDPAGAGSGPLDVPSTKPADAPVANAPKTPTRPALPHVPVNRSTASAVPESAAYALVNGRWEPLPENNGQVVQTRTDLFTAKLTAEILEEEAAAGKRSNLNDVAVGQLLFERGNWSSFAIANEVVLAYVGALPSLPADDLSRYPLLRTYPEVELALTKSSDQGGRYATLYLIAPGHLRFCSTRVTATIEHPARDVTVLRVTGALLPGSYAFACGTKAYEVAVR